MCIVFMMHELHKQAEQLLFQIKSLRKKAYSSAMEENQHLFHWQVIARVACRRKSGRSEALLNEKGDENNDTIAPCQPTMLQPAQHSTSHHT